MDKKELRSRWLLGSSKASIAVLFLCTNSIMDLAAVTTNPSMCMIDPKKPKIVKPPHLSQSC